MFKLGGMSPAVFAIFTASASAVPLATVGYAQVSHCVSGTVATFLGTTCELDAGGTSDKVTYTFNSSADGGYTCTGTASICTNLGTNGSNIIMQLDPIGSYVFDIGNTDLWNVSGNESVDVKIQGTVQGIVFNGNWPRFNGLLGQTGGGVEENITAVDCSSTNNCLDSHKGVSEVACDPLDSNGPDCDDYRCPILTILSRISCFNVDDAAMKDSSTPYPLTIEIKLSANGGTATLYAIGTHLYPPNVTPGPPEAASDVKPGPGATLDAVSATGPALKARTMTSQNGEVPVPGAPPYCNPCLFYGGDLNGTWADANAVANDNTLLVSNTPTFIPFTVGSPGWSVTGLFTNVVTYGYNRIDPAQANWSISTGMSDGNAGTVIASGTSSATFTTTGRHGFGSHYEYTVLVNLDPPVDLAPGQYWLSVVPQCTVTGNNCESAQYFVSNTQGANSYGPPEPSGMSFLNSMLFGHSYSNVCDLVSAPACNLFSGGVLGTVQ